ncbi:hemolysin III family protein [Candidatus Saccharibacteria bacterium]|nr:hemolysin III family protein [Candidatus Saccharibacteria bacterium]
MVQKLHAKAPEYSLGEEIVNSVSHGLGAALSIAGLILLVLKAETPLAVVACCLYSAFAIVLFTVSCVYHALPAKYLGKHVLRVIDHCNVLTMVAGTYIPICLSLLGGSLGWTLFGIVWGLTIPAVVLNAINVNKFQVVSVFHSLILGWGIFFLLQPLKNSVPWNGLLWFLIGGGVCYTLGAILYGIGSQKKWFHSIFHIFVLAGAILHWFFIYLYCI